MKKVSLEKQCEELSLQIEEIQLSYEGKPEPALLKYYESLGYVGSYIEGYTFLTVLKALMLDKLAKLNTFILGTAYSIQTRNMLRSNRRCSEFTAAPPP